MPQTVICPASRFLVSVSSNETNSHFRKIQSISKRSENPSTGEPKVGKSFKVIVFMFVLIIIGE